jgi:DNA/RNA-binding domain of Phe-tRNA-synthetase-like protein
MLNVDPHSQLDLVAFEVVFTVPLGEFSSSESLRAALDSCASAPMSSSDHIRLKVRDLLRVGGFKPTGRSKPASEYLIKAADKGQLTSINLAVDLCNVVSLHSGLPISVVDLDRVAGDLRVGLAVEDASYPFNLSGQLIDVGSLLCLHDEKGPCANAVKDSQRTKTHDGTHRCLYLIWGSAELPGRCAQTAAWLRTLLEEEGGLEGKTGLFLTVSDEWTSRRVRSTC